MKRPPLTWPSLVARWIVAGAFLAASLPKIAQPDAFALAVFRYHLLPDILVNFAAITLPWIELAAAVALLAGGPYRRPALCVMLALLAVFSAALAINLARGLDIACGCFTVDIAARPAGWQHLLLNAALFGTGLLAGVQKETA